MSRKDFVALADAIREHNRIAANVERNAQAAGESEPSMRTFTSEQLATLADFCKSQNSAFKRERWMSYIAGESGPNGGTVKH